MITKFGKFYSRLIDFESGDNFRNMKTKKENETRYVLEWKTINLMKMNI